MRAISLRRYTLALAAAFALTAWATLALATLMAGPLGRVWPWERDLVATLHRAARAYPALTAAMRAVAWLAAAGPMSAVAATGLGWLAWGRRWHAALALGAAQVGQWGLGLLVKPIMARPRPDFQPVLHPASGFSFPSGHAAVAVAVVGLLAVLAWRHLRPGWRGPAVALLVLLAAAAVFGRLWLGAHWPLDLVAGAALGLFWLAWLLWLLHRGLAGP